MIIEVKIPSPGESVTEVEISSWLVSDGDYVEEDQEIAEVESDKATLPLIAEESGKISIIAETGKTITVNSVAATIDTSVKTQPGAVAGKDGISEEKLHSAGDKAEKILPGNENTDKAAAGKKQSIGDRNGDGRQDKIIQGSTSKEKDIGHKASAAEVVSHYDKTRISPLAKKLMEEKGLTIDDVISGLRRISKEDVALVAEMKENNKLIPEKEATVSRKTNRQKMSMLRRKLSQRLIEVKNQTAMLTTFNEVDMSSIIAMRKTSQEKFIDKHGVKLGFMSFFVKAVTQSLKLYPNVNSYIDGEEIVTPEYCDIGIAVQTDKGLMVPVIRNTETLGLADIEKTILELAGKARKNRISIDDMSGGTFTITNGGIFGSLLSTPILNPPQSGILGMHNIVERPVAIAGKVEIRPMMYIALSYDHRIIDGKDSVGFLVKIKEMLEDPVKLLSGGADHIRLLLDI